MRRTLQKQVVDEESAFANPKGDRRVHLGNIYPGLHRAIRGEEHRGEGYGLQEGMIKKMDRKREPEGKRYAPKAAGE